MKIKCDNIRAQFFNNTHSKDIEVIKPNFVDINSHYFHEFTNPIYVPLLNTTLRDLTFELTDEFDHKLKLDEGIATILQLSFKRMTSINKSFSIRLTPMLNENNNTINQFTNILPSTLNLNENWRVGLKEISFPSNIKTFPNDNNEIIVTLMDEAMNYIPLSKYHCKIPNQKYDATTLVKTLNDRVARHNSISFLITDNVLSVISKENCEIEISYNIAKILSLDFTTTSPDYAKIKLIKHKRINIGNKINWILFRPAYLMVYSELVKQSLISSAYTDILRVVPITKEEKDIEYQSIEFQNVEYRELANNIVNIIKIEIRSHSGELVPFDSNFLCLHLFFTNNPYEKDL